MDHYLRTSASIILESTKETVWKALITPDSIAKYLYGTETISNWAEGEEIVFQGEYEGWKYKDKGVIRVFNPNEQLSYTYWTQFNNLDDLEENYSLVKIDINPTEKDGEVELTWSQAGYKDKATRERSQDGLDSLLKRFKTFVEA